MSKYEEKELSLSTENPLQEYKKSIFDYCKWYITHMAQLILSYIPQQAQDVFKTSLLDLFSRIYVTGCKSDTCKASDQKRALARLKEDIKKTSFYSKPTVTAKCCSTFPVRLEKKWDVNQTTLRRLTKRRHYPD